MRRSRLIGLIVALVTAAAVAPVATGAVSVGSLTTSDAVFDTGVSRPAGDLARLQAAAKDLAAKGFPTKFVVIAKPAANMDREARRLRRGLAAKLGPDAVKAVLVLAPHTLGVDAKVLACERRLAFAAEVPTLKSDDIQGTINIARRLQGYDEQQALRDSNCKEIEPASSGGGSGGKKGLLIVLLAAGGLLIAAIVFFARRASRQDGGDDAKAAAGPAADTDAPPTGEPPDASDAADAPDHDG